MVTVGLAQRPEVVLEEGSQGWDQLGEGPTEGLNPSEPTRGAMHTIAGDPSGRAQERSQGCRYGGHPLDRMHTTSLCGGWGRGHSQLGIHCLKATEHEFCWALGLVSEGQDPNRQIHSHHQDGSDY